MGFFTLHNLHNRKIVSSVNNNDDDDDDDDDDNNNIRLSTKPVMAM